MKEEFIVDIFGVDKLVGKVRLDSCPDNINKLLDELDKLFDGEKGEFKNKVKTEYSIIKNGQKINDFSEEVNQDDKLILIGNYLGG